MPKRLGRRRGPNEAPREKTGDTTGRKTSSGAGEVEARRENTPRSHTLTQEHDRRLGQRCIPCTSTKPTDTHLEGGAFCRHTGYCILPMVPTVQCTGFPGKGPQTGRTETHVLGKLQLVFLLLLFLTLPTSAQRERETERKVREIGSRIRIRIKTNTTSNTALRSPHDLRSKTSSTPSSLPSIIQTIARLFSFSFTQYANAFPSCKPSP